MVTSTALFDSEPQRKAKFATVGCERQAPLEGCPGEFPLLQTRSEDTQTYTHTDTHTHVENEGGRRRECRTGKGGEEKTTKR